MEAKNFVVLGQRKDEIEVTLRYLEKERHEIEDNFRWVDKAAYQSRVAFLDEIAGWYRDELAELNRTTADTKSSSFDESR